MLAGIRYGGRGTKRVIRVIRDHARHLTLLDSLANARVSFLRFLLFFFFFQSLDESGVYTYVSVCVSGSKISKKCRFATRGGSPRAEYSPTFRIYMQRRGARVLQSPPRILFLSSPHFARVRARARLSFIIADSNRTIRERASTSTSTL